ncbi:MAG: hypothetical protein ACXVB1_14380 [Pseudobdellovibrionaceae bacterium]
MLQNNLKKSLVIFLAATTAFFTILSGAHAKANHTVSYNYLCNGEHGAQESMLLLQDTSSRNQYVQVTFGKMVMQYVPIDHDPAYSTNDGFETFDTNGTYPKLNVLDNPYDKKVKIVNLYPAKSITGGNIMEFQCILSSQD